MKPKWMLIGFALGVVSLVVMATTWFPEGNRPLQSDNSQKSLQKINDLLYGGGAGLTVQATFGGTLNTDTNMVLRSRTNNVYAEVEDGQVWVNVKTMGATLATDTNANLHSYGPPGSTTTIGDDQPFPVKDTNVLARLANLESAVGVVTNQANANFQILTNIQQQIRDNATNGAAHTIVDNTASGTTEANAVIFTNQFLGAISNLNYIANQYLSSLSNNAAYPPAGTNQVSFSVNTTNLCASVGGEYSSPTAGVVLWACTNTLFGQNGGSGLINTFWYSSLTNQEFRLHIYNQEFASPATNATFALTQTQRQWEIPGSPISSTNSDWGDWVVTGTTNYTKTVRNLGLPIQNTANAKTVLLIAEALGTGKSNLVATATYAKIGALLDKP